MLELKALFLREFVDLVCANARYVGLDSKVHLQHILTATAMNAIRLFAWFEGVPLAKTRVSSFAKLAPN